MDRSFDRIAAVRDLGSDRGVAAATGTAPSPHECGAGRVPAVLVAALIVLALLVVAGGVMGDTAHAAGSPGAAAGEDNWNFEAGDLSGWRTRSAGSGAWRVYEDGASPPDPSDSDPFFPFAVPDPPEGRFAAVTDMSAPGARILFRDVRLSGPQRLRLTLFYDNRVVERFFTPPTLRFEDCAPNQQLRIDVMNPIAPIGAMSGRAVLATVFETVAGDPATIEPTTVAFNLSRWAGRTVRLRFAQVDNRGPLRAGIDDVRFEPLARQDGR